MIDVRILIAGAACLVLIQGARAQSAPAELLKARAAFAAAVAANNEKAAAELSAFPLINRVDQEKPAIPRSEFRGLFKTYREVGSVWSWIGSSPKRPLRQENRELAGGLRRQPRALRPEERPLAAYRLRKRQRVKREPRGFPGDRSAIDLVERAYPRCVRSAAWYSD